MSIPSSGSSTVCSALTISSRSTMRTGYPSRRTSSFRSRAKKWMLSAKRTQLQRMHITSECVRALSVEEADAAQEVAVRDSGRDDDHVARARDPRR